MPQEQFLKVKTHMLCHVHSPHKNTQRVLSTGLLLAVDPNKPLPPWRLFAHDPLYTSQLVLPVHDLARMTTRRSSGEDLKPRMLRFGTKQSISSYLDHHFKCSTCHRIIKDLPYPIRDRQAKILVENIGQCRQLNPAVYRRSLS